MKEAIDMELENYYGSVVAVKEDGEFYLQLEDWDGMNKVGISERLYEQIKKEFK